MSEDQTSMGNRSRLRLVVVTNEQMSGVFTGSLDPRNAFNLPRDARIIRGFYNKDIRSFQYVVRSNEFEPIQSGDAIPVHQG